jgi:hypothetical protein
VLIAVRCASKEKETYGRSSKTGDEHELQKFCEDRTIPFDPEDVQAAKDAVWGKFKFEVVSDHEDETSGLYFVEIPDQNSGVRRYERGTNRSVKQSEADNFHSKAPAKEKFDDISGKLRRDHWHEGAHERQADAQQARMDRSYSSVEPLVAGGAAASLRSVPRLTANAPTVKGCKTRAASVHPSRHPDEDSQDVSDYEPPSPVTVMKETRGANKT